MEPLTITLSAAGRPFLTTRVNSVTFDPSGRLGRVDREARATVGGPPPAATNSARTIPSSGPLPTEGGAGFGAEARRAAVQANAAEAANLPAAPASNDANAEGPDGLTEAERDQVEKLKARDAEVRRHEQAHAAVGGQYASAPSYTFQQGPDGRRYAIGGEVQIDVAPVPGDPEATIDKMGVVKAAALAPAEPSSADRRVAAFADAQRLQAMAELATLKTEERMEMLAETSTGAGAERSDADASIKAQPDSRFADAAGILSRAEETLPGQKLNRAA